jgi:hypothetical protein
MTAPKRIIAKLFVENPQDVQPEAIVHLFHRWIQQHAVEGLLIDVADYKHVFNGPGTILIGHEGDYAYTTFDGRAGLQYTLKQSEAESLNEALAITLRRAVDAAEKLQADESLSGVRVNFREIQIALADRLQYPNQPEVLATVQPHVQALANVLFGGETVVQVADDDNRNLITFIVKSETAISLQDVTQRLAVAQVG